MDFDSIPRGLKHHDQELRNLQSQLMEKHRLQMDAADEAAELAKAEAVEAAVAEERDRFEQEKKELKAEFDRALHLAQAGI